MASRTGRWAGLVYTDALWQPSRNLRRAVTAPEVIVLIVPACCDSHRSLLEKQLMCALMHFRCALASALALTLTLTFRVLRPLDCFGGRMIRFFKVIFQNDRNCNDICCDWNRVFERFLFPLVRRVVATVGSVYFILTRLEGPRDRDSSGGLVRQASICWLCPGKDGSCCNCLDWSTRAWQENLVTIWY